MLRKITEVFAKYHFRKTKKKCQECLKDCIFLKDVNLTVLDKAKYTNLVEEACRAKDETDMKREMTEKMEK